MISEMNQTKLESPPEELVIPTVVRAPLHNPAAATSLVLQGNKKKKGSYQRFQPIKVSNSVHATSTGSLINDAILRDSGDIGLMNGRLDE